MHGCKIWRLLDTGSMPGSLNMAVDEALLNLFDPAVSLPVLRLYGWSAPTFSVGRFQKIDSVLDYGRCQRDGIAVVRRMTGGGAIYHASELGYSIICHPGQLSLSSSVKQSYRQLTSFLLNFYARLGLDAAYAADLNGFVMPSSSVNGFCFSSNEPFDILINGAKIGGNAQRRIKKAIFQHGLIPICNHYCEGLHYRPGEVSESLSRTTSLHDCGVQAAIEDIKADLLAAFSETFDVDFKAIPLSGDELRLAQALEEGKYMDCGWGLTGYES